MFPKQLKIKSGESLIIREATPADAADMIKYVNEVAGESEFLTLGAGDFKKTVNVQANNEAAIALYEKFDFEKEGNIRRDSFIAGKFYDAYAMGILIN